MIIQPTRRDLLKYTSAGLLASKLRGQSIPFPGPGMVHSAGGAGPALVISGSNAGANTFTVTLNTTGANFIVASTQYYFPNFNVSPPALTENKGNGTPLSLTVYQDGTLASIIRYWENPTVGSSHVFTLSDGGLSFYSTLIVRAFSGMLTSSLFQSGTDHGLAPGSAGTTIQPGSGTASGSTLWIFHVGFDASATFTFDSSMQFAGDSTDYRNFGSGVNYGGAQAYLIQASGGALNPKATASASVTLSCADAAFKGA